VEYVLSRSSVCLCIGSNDAAHEKNKAVKKPCTSQKQAQKYCELSDKGDSVRCPYHGIVFDEQRAMEKKQLIGISAAPE